MTAPRYEPESERRCFICGEHLAGYTTRVITVLGTLRVGACAPCADLPDTPEFVDALITERLMTAPVHREEGE